MSEPLSQRKYNKRYQKAHRNRQNHYTDKSKTKKFILTESSLKELNQVDKWSEIRRRELKK